MNKYDVAFNKFFSLIKPDEEFRGEVSRRREAIVSAVNREFTGSNTSNNSIFVGSYGRNTATKYSDVDLAVILSDRYRSQFDRYAHNGQSALLQSVKNAILDHYPRTDIGGDGQIVSVRFSDGLLFEVLPAFRVGIGDSRLYYPDTHNGGRWRTTDPCSEINAISRLNYQHGERVYNVCRALRVWNNYNDAGMTGYSIDAVVCNYFMLHPPGVDMDYSKIFCSLFQYIYDTRFNLWWLMIGSNENLSFNLNERVIERVMGQREKIIVSSVMDLPSKTLEIWGDVFGPEFPTG